MDCKKNKFGNRKSARFQIVSAISYKENLVVVWISHTIIILLVFIYLVIFFFICNITWKIVNAQLVQRGPLLLSLFVKEKLENHRKTPKITTLIISEDDQNNFEITKVYPKISKTLACKYLLSITVS